MDKIKIKKLVLDKINKIEKHLVNITEREKEITNKGHHGSLQEV